MDAVKNALAAKQLAEIRRELLRTLARLERSLNGSGTQNARDLEQDTVGRLSRIEALQNQGLTNSLRERERTQLAQVVDALRRIEEGTYGTCGACGHAIPFERLVVFPEAAACAGCAVAA